MIMRTSGEGSQWTYLPEGLHGVQHAVDGSRLVDCGGIHIATQGFAPVSLRRGNKD
jgi:hypothetical protein